jgi:3D (Asp-Asp-Asp) domain-containing protein
VSVERRKKTYTNLCIIVVAPAVFALGTWLYIEMLDLIWEMSARSMMGTILFGVGVAGVCVAACLYVIAVIVAIIITKWGPK